MTLLWIGILFFLGCIGGIIFLAYLDSKEGPKL